MDHSLDQNTRQNQRFGRDPYRQLRDQLEFHPAPWPTLAVVLFDCLLVWCAVQLLERGILSFVLSQLLLAIVFFNAFAILHECGHETASPWRRFNTLLGHVASTFCCTPYFPWKYIHQKHHTFAGSIDLDPVAKSLRRWRDSRVPTLVRVCWWAWIPLGALLQHVVYLAYPLTMWREGQLTRGRRWRVLVSVAWVPASFAGLWWLAPNIVHISNFWLAVVFYLIAEELVNIPHHVDLLTSRGRAPLWEQHHTTRSCYYPRGVSELLVLNFNFHIEHHLFPNLPWYRLRSARVLVRAALGAEYREVIGIGWNLEHRTRDLQRIVERYRTHTAEVATSAGTDY